ncbi:MAG: hypothetical protein L0G22_04405 [Propionibacteriaceae bacterium]|nr:hypothetical protein [Propionibacteriaceae bacterium]
MPGWDDQTTTDGPATDTDLGVGGLGAEDEPDGVLADAERDDPLVGSEPARPGRPAEPGSGGDDEGHIDEKSGHGDEGPLGKEI